MQLNWTYRKRNRVLLVAVGAGIILCYFLSIHETISAYKAVNNLNRKLQQVERTPDLITDLQNQIAVLDDKLGSGKPGIDDPKDRILQVVTTYCALEGTVLTDVPIGESWNENNVALQLHSVTIQGSFVRLVKLLYELEFQEETGHVVSVDFNTVRQRGSKIPALRMTAFIQHVQKEMKP